MFPSQFVICQPSGTNQMACLVVCNLSEYVLGVCVWQPGGSTSNSRPVCKVPSVDHGSVGNPRHGGFVMRRNSVGSTSVFSVGFGTHALPQEKQYAQPLPIDYSCVSPQKLLSDLLGVPNTLEIIWPGRLHNAGGGCPRCVRLQNPFHIP